MNQKLSNLGFTEKLLRESEQYPDFFPGRVVLPYKEYYRVAVESGEVTAELSGKFRYLSRDMSDYPVVGDFVMLDRESDQKGNAIIHAVLPRKSALERKAAGTTEDTQVVAANIDTVFICMSFNRDFNLRRLERYLSVAWNSGAVPVVVLTKSDLCGDLPQKRKQVEEVALGVDVIITSSLSREGYEPIRSYISAGKTVAFIGSSGVGKSTLINLLSGEERLSTGEVRKDGRGRHTSTRRELIFLPCGGAVIDTPGMREIGIEGGDFANTFADIEGLAGRCRFYDCTHTKEPGCAVRQALEEGLITQERLSSYRKLKKEAKYEGLNSRQIEKEKIDTMFADFGGIKNAKEFIRSRARKR